MSYFQRVRIYSLAELAVFAALLVVWLGSLSERWEAILGWTHGLGWIGLCIAVARGCTRGLFPWWLLGATVSPLGPIGSTLGFELIAWRNRRAASRSAAVDL